MKRLLLGMCVFVATFGCGNNEPKMAEAEYADKSKMTAVASKAFSDGREWGSLTAEEKKPFTDFYKDEAKSKEAFDKILNGLKYFAGGGSAPKGP